MWSTLVNPWLTKVDRSGDELTRVDRSRAAARGHRLGGAARVYLQSIAVTAVEVGADTALGRAMSGDQAGAAMGATFLVARRTNGDHPTAGTLELDLAPDLHGAEPRAGPPARHPWKTAE